MAFHLAASIAGGGVRLLGQGLGTAFLGQGHHPALPGLFAQKFAQAAGKTTVGAVARALPPHLRIEPPKKFGEIGWIIDGMLLNHDTYGYQPILSLMYENGLIYLLAKRLGQQRHLRIVEIGGG